MSKRAYEFRPRGKYTQTEALENVIEDIRACARLGIDFNVSTERSKEFRNGGNVVKADVVAYIVETGSKPEAKSQ